MVIFDAKDIYSTTVSRPNTTQADKRQTTNKCGRKQGPIRTIRAVALLLTRTFSAF